MSLVNSRRDMTPFDMSRRPVRQNALLMPLIWAVCHVMTRKMGLVRVERRGMDIKPPYIVIAAHQGFPDYYVAPRAMFPHRANFVSDMEGFAAFGNELYRSIGCIGKRRYTADISVIRNIQHALFKLHQPVVIYPESRHCDAGITSSLPDNIGKMIKFFGVPVAVLTVHGSYLASPFWDEERTRKTRLTAKIELLLDIDGVRDTSEAEISRMIADALEYDEYAYQLENRIAITDRPAQGLHLPLYKCRECMAEGDMHGEGNTLTCRSCGAQWVMDEYGRLSRDGEYIHIPEWYRWERAEAEREADGSDISWRVDVEALPNEKGFVPLGSGILRHSRDGFVLTLDDSREIRVSSASAESAQTEYNYRGRGKCIVLSTKDCCYYCYCKDPSFIVTKLEFTAEYYHRMSRGDDL